MLISYNKLIYIKTCLKFRAYTVSLITLIYNCTKTNYPFDRTWWRLTHHKLTHTNKVQNNITLLFFFFLQIPNVLNVSKMMHTICSIWWMNTLLALIISSSPLSFREKAKKHTDTKCKMLSDRVESDDERETEKMPVMDQARRRENDGLCLQINS